MAGRFSVGAILPHMNVYGGVRRYIELGNVFVARGHEFVIYSPDGRPPEWLDFRGKSRKLDSIDTAVHDVVLCGSPELLDFLDSMGTRIRIFYIQGENVLGARNIIGSGRYRIMVNSSGLAKKVRRRYGIEPLHGIGGVNTDLFRVMQGGERSGPFKVLCYGRSL